LTECSENKKKVIILEAHWAKPLSLTCHFVLRKLYTEPSIGVSYQYQLIWPTGIREDFKKRKEKKVNHKQELHMAATLIVRSAQNIEMYSPLLAY
jgi:hypothetical protein